ncbi:ArsR/SmtB family transcription factor [Mesorhizobium australicum]|uniref:Transcriptional regulator, ArsR family n=1 Tax=Mesorhizobium australicum TaxID=536018 RepID=A0A1X7NZC9_9HYPH|nr:metalloregulator ArsR/SmtB family transcription factor [Mesorhizobium australicum]SMH43799.1 transcriptional regulator, ArsR family [Mesorhizobium australicum]
MNLIELQSSEAAALPCALDEMASRLAALSHPARLRILRHLSGRGACCCKEVVEQLDLAQSTVSQHLKVLVDAGLVRFSPERQRSRYTVNIEEVARLSRALSGYLDDCGATSCCD